MLIFPMIFSLAIQIAPDKHHNAFNRERHVIHNRVNLKVIYLKPKFLQYFAYLL